ncbi:hypothetical protein B0H11DRAFT_1993551, partial [Mycena galericulata]
TYKARGVLQIKFSINMYFTHSILEFAVLAIAAVKAAPTPSTTLTKRWCGFDLTCPCDLDPEVGCMPQYDECGKMWYWPGQCNGPDKDAHFPSLSRHLHAAGLILRTLPIS